MEKVIITAAICGAELTREDTPHLPLTPEELAEEALRAEEAGASIIHLHVRDEEGRPSQKEEDFRRTVEEMEKAGVSAIIQASTGGAADMSPDERIEALKIEPEMASLDCGSINFGDEVFVNTMSIQRRFAREMKERGVMPELECFETGHIHNALKLNEEELLPEHLHFDLVLGVPGGMPASARSLLFMLDQLPPDATWTVAGIGRYELPLAYHALALGGHVRVGLEDNIYYEKGRLAESNGELVARVKRLAGELGRKAASPAEARDMLGLPLDQA